MKQKRLIAKILINAALFVLLISTPARSQVGKASSVAELASYTGADRERVLIEGAKREGKVSWYTTLAANQNKQIAKAFETKYPGVKVETFRTGSGALIETVLTPMITISRASPEVFQKNASGVIEPLNWV